MNLAHAILLGLVQGLTEFLPISSSGHLIIFGTFLGAHQSLSFDVALHVGTLAAVIAVFGGDYAKMIKATISKPNYATPEGRAERRLGFVVLTATLPAAAAGLFLGGAAETVFRQAWLVAIALIAVALFMLWAEQHSSKSEDERAVGYKTGLIIGLSQVLALVPGVSRSGITITAGLLKGLNRQAATRFSFWLSAPIIAGAAIRVLVQPQAVAEMSAAPVVFLAGMAAAALSGYVTIKFMLSFLAKHSLSVFAYYRIGLGVVVIAIELL